MDLRLAARRHPSRPPPRSRARRQVALARRHTRRPFPRSVRLLPLGRGEAEPGLETSVAVRDGTYHGNPDGGPGEVREGKEGQAQDQGKGKQTSGREFPWDDKEALTEGPCGIRSALLIGLPNHLSEHPVNTIRTDSVDH